MPSQTKTLNNATDVYVTSRRPKLTRNATSKLLISSGGDGNTQRAFLFFSLPFPFGSTVLDSKFRLTQSDAVTGSVTLTVQAVTGRWNAGKINWDNQPSTTTTNQVSLTKSNPGAATLWEFDIDGIIQAASTSGVWWGLRVTSNLTGATRFYSAQSSSTARPELEATWTNIPQPPENPSPAGGRAVSVTKPIVYFTADDDTGNTDISAIQIQYKASNTGFDSITGFSSPSYDSGSQAASAPMLDTSAITSPVAPALTGTVTYWTARYQDAAGVWSAWMDPESMRYVALPAATLDNPPSATPVVNDATPPVLWTMTGMTAYKFTVALASDPNTILYNSGKVTTTTDDSSIPSKVLTKLNTDYVIDLYLWDNVSREKNGSNQVFVRITRTFQYQASGSVTAPSSVTATAVTGFPWVDITWTRASAPDEFTILRDGEVIDANILSSLLSTGGTSYSYRDKLANPRESHVWSVQAVVNSVASNKADSSSFATRVIAPTMMELDGSNPVMFLSPAVDPQLVSIQEVQQPVNADPVLLTQFLGGFTGHLEGIFSDNALPGVTARQMRNIFKKWKRNPGNSYILYLVDEAMTVVPYNMTYRPRAKSGNTVIYDIAFDFFEVD